MNRPQNGASTRIRTSPAAICQTPEIMHIGKMDMEHQTPMNIATRKEYLVYTVFFKTISTSIIHFDTTQRELFVVRRKVNALRNLKMCYNYTVSIIQNRNNIFAKDFATS